MQIPAREPHLDRRKFSTALKCIKHKMMDSIEIRASKSWRREVIEYFEDLEIICDYYNRTVLRYLGKLNRLLHEKQIDQNECDALNRCLLQASEALNDIPKTIVDLK